MFTINLKYYYIELHCIYINLFLKCFFKDKKLKDSKFKNNYRV